MKEYEPEPDSEQVDLEFPSDSASMTGEEYASHLDIYVRVCADH